MQCPFSLLCLHKIHIYIADTLDDRRWLLVRLLLLSSLLSTWFCSFVYIHFSMGESNECMTCIYEALVFFFFLITFMVRSFLSLSCVHVIRFDFLSPSVFQCSAHHIWVSHERNSLAHICLETISSKNCFPTESISKFYCFARSNEV